MATITYKFNNKTEKVAIPKIPKYTVFELTYSTFGEKLVKKRKIGRIEKSNLIDARKVLYKMVRDNQNTVNEMNGHWYALYENNKRSFTSKFIGKATGDGMSMLWDSNRTSAYLYKDGTVGQDDKEGPKW